MSRYRQRILVWLGRSCSSTQVILYFLLVRRYLQASVTIHPSSYISSYTSTPITHASLYFMVPLSLIKLSSLSEQDSCLLQNSKHPPNIEHPLKLNIILPILWNRFIRYRGSGHRPMVFIRRRFWSTSRLRPRNAWTGIHTRDTSQPDVLAIT